MGTDRGPADRGGTSVLDPADPAGGRARSRTAAAAWEVKGVSADAPTVEVAVRVLRDRLGRVREGLRRATEDAVEDPEHVHRLRVGSRRAAAALRLFEDLVPPRRLAWMEAQLKRIRRAAGEARDCDVLIGRLQAHRSRGAARRWLAAVRDERAEAQEAIAAVDRRLSRSDRLARRIDKLLRRIESRGPERSPAARRRFGDWAPGRLRPLVARYFAAVPADEDDEGAWHRFRIRGKDLRYAMELTAPAFPAEFRTRLYPLIAEIQDRLGAINDHATARDRLRRRIAEAGDAKEAARCRRLLADEQARLDRSLGEFRAWCRPAVLTGLRAGFEEAFRRGPEGAAGPGRGAEP